MSGRDKGNAAEREVARLLERWWGELEPDTQFSRTPLSGVLQHSAEFQMCGDLMVSRDVKRWPFVVEVKRREAWSMRELRAGRACPVWGWWRHCQEDAHEQGGEPMLWFRKNREPWWVMLRRDFIRRVVNPRIQAEWTAAENLPLGSGAEPVLLLGLDLLALPPAILALPQP